MGSKFLVNKDAIFFSTHGEIYADLIFSSYTNNDIDKDFRLAGFFNHDENLAHVSKIEKVILKNCYLINLSGVGVQNSQSFVYSEQKFIKTDGTSINIKEVNPNDILVSLNGHVNINYVELINEDTDFYILECDKEMPNIYINNIIMLPITETEIEKGFFIKSKTK